MTVNEFITLNSACDIHSLALQKNRYPEFTDADFSFALQQIEGRQRTKDKLPFLQNSPEWHFPKRLSTEQCSSEETARYKASLVSGETLTDLTGGMGIDILFMSDHFDHAHYVEKDAELCRLAKHNFTHYQTQKHKNIEVHHADATIYLNEAGQSDVIYMDPARRAISGRKVYRLEDCTPNVIELLPALRTRCSTLLFKLSPMLDLTAALQQLPEADEVHILSVRNEVKEVLIRCRFTPQAASGTAVEAPVFHAVILSKDNPPFDFIFRQEDESNAPCRYASKVLTYLFEPDAAIMKAGAFRTVACRYSLQKLAVNSHLYTSNVLPEHFPGRIWKVSGVADKRTIKGERFHILSRNYPLSADDIRKKYRILEGTDQWLIATRISDRPLLILAERI